MSNEEIVLMIQNRENKKENMQQLWQKNRGYINKIVNHYKAYAEEEDLQQEAYLGLYEAIKHYNLEEQVPFITYAGHWIRQYIGRYIRSNGVIRIPEFMQGRISEYNKMVQKWQQRYHRKPTDEEIMHFLDISIEMLDNLKKAAQMAKIGSLDVPVGEDEECSLYELIPGSMDEEEQVESMVLEKVQKEELYNTVWPLVDSLTDNQAKTIRARYQENKTFKEIAEAQGVSIEMARQRERQGLRELRKPSKSKLLRPFLPEDNRIYSMGLRGNGVGSFNRTWTSSTERIVLKDWEIEEREWLKRMGCQEM